MSETFSGNVELVAGGSVGSIRARRTLELRPVSARCRSAQNSTYTITVTNNGPSAANTVVLDRYLCGDGIDTSYR